MGTRSKFLSSTRDTLAKVSDEAQAQAMRAEDALASLEDREARRATRDRRFPR